MKTTAARYIDASKETYAKLARVFDCTEKNIYLALTYRSESEQSRKIRYTAVKNYGATPMCHYPECETMHNTTDGDRPVMVQYFDNGVKLEVDKQNGDVRAWDRHGVQIMAERVEKIADLSKIQVLLENR